MWTYSNKQSLRYVYADVSKGLKNVIWLHVFSITYVSTLHFHKLNACQTARHEDSFLESKHAFSQPWSLLVAVLNSGQQSMVNSPSLAITYHDNNSTSVSLAQCCSPSLTAHSDTPNTFSGLSKPCIRSCFYMMVWWKGKLGNNSCGIIATAEEMDSYLNHCAWDSDRPTPLLEHAN